MMTAAWSLLRKLADEGFSVTTKDGALDIQPGDKLGSVYERQLVELRAEVLLWLTDPLLAAVVERAENDPPVFPGEVQSSEGVQSAECRVQSERQETSASSSELCTLHSELCTPDELCTPPGKGAALVRESVLVPVKDCGEPAGYMAFDPGYWRDLCDLAALRARDREAKAARRRKKERKMDRPQGLGLEDMP